MITRINFDYYPKLKSSAKKLSEELDKLFPNENHNKLEMVFNTGNEIIGVDLRYTTDDNNIYTGMGDNGEATTAPISFKSETKVEWFKKVLKFTKQYNAQSIHFNNKTTELNVSVVYDDLPKLSEDEISGDLVLIVVVPNDKDAGDYKYQAQQSAAFFRSKGIQAKIALVDRRGENKWIVIAPESQFTQASKILKHLQVIPNWTEDGKISFKVRGSAYEHMSDESINEIEIVDNFVLTQEQIDRYNNSVKD